jgi:23S rRNA pseudouridine1911/1915/1917 synthase
MAKRQMLHAWKLGFTHPHTDQHLSFACLPPDDFTERAKAFNMPAERIVLTGLAGSGKSQVAKILGSLGCPVWNADAEVNRLYEYTKDGWQILHQRFAGRFTAQGRAVDKTALGFAMQQEPGLKGEVEALIHPLVGHSLNTFWQGQAMQAPMLIAEVPLWYEVGLDAQFKQVMVIGVECHARARHDRLAYLRGWSEAQIAAADIWHLGQKAKYARCDYVLANDAGLDELEEKVRRIYTDIMARREIYKKRLWDQLKEIFIS